MYQYLMYGLIVHSDIPLYNLTQTIGTPDINIIYGKINYNQVPESSNSFYYTNDYVCFESNHGAFSISNGNQIIVEPTSDATPLQLAAYIMGWGFAFLFTQRGYSALHGTALTINGKGIIVSGISGSGKSTTALSLIKKGFRYLADDIVMLNPDRNSDIVPGYPIQKVCHDVVNNITSENLLYINEERDKYSYLNIKEYSNVSSKLTSLFLIKCEDIPSVTVEEITGLNKYLRTLECLFLAEIYSFKDTPAGDRYRCLKIAEQIHLYIITRPKKGNTLNEVTELIHNITTQ